MSQRSFDPTLHIHEALESLGIDPSAIVLRKLQEFEEAKDLVVADVSRSGRQHLLTPATAHAWLRMRRQAQEAGISLLIISAFRSIERQIELVKSKLDKGLCLESILSESAPPGYSEHHTGRAIDIGTPGCPPLAPEFAITAAYDWLTAHARQFDFELSYPKGNELGFCYEPWHWCHLTNDA